MSLGKKLLDLRMLKNIKQEQVAYDLEIAQSTYSDWENDISFPKRSNLKKLAEYYNVDINELLEDVYNISVKNKENAIALINSPNAKINSTQAIIKISESLEKLTILIEKLVNENK
jgi:transcriptional regulator with XRE-family HTH domain